MGEKRAIITLGLLAIVGMTIVFILLFASLWQYRVWVGGTLFALVVLLVVVIMRGLLVKQEARQTRFQHRTETPLDENGEPRFWHPGTQINPYRAQPLQTPYYQGYQAWYQAERSRL
jgi:hypothetical protein